MTSGGKPSITHYEVIEAFRSASLAEVHLETGRTHQIRVHFSALRHPCVGDLTYGADPTLAAKVGLTRQWLHAVRLGFEHPATGQPVEFSSEYPDDLAAALEIVAASLTSATRAAAWDVARPRPDCPWRDLDFTPCPPAPPRRTRSRTCTSTPSTPCSTVRRASTT